MVSRLAQSPTDGPAGHWGIRTSARPSPELRRPSQTALLSRDRPWTLVGATIIELDDVARLVGAMARQLLFVHEIETVSLGTR